MSNRFVRPRLPALAPIRPVLLSAAVALAVGCGGSGVLGPTARTDLTRGAEGRASGPSGLEQRLVTSVQAPPPGSPYTALLVATSTLRNAGSAPVRATARLCFFQESDFESTASLDRFEPLVSCSAVEMTKELAPGETVGPLEVRFGVRSGPGQYTLKLRHSLDPAFRAEAGFQVP